VLERGRQRERERGIKTLTEKTSKEIIDIHEGRSWREICLKSSNSYLGKKAIKVFFFLVSHKNVCRETEKRFRS